VAHIEKKRNAYRVLVQIREGKNILEDPTLKLIFKKSNGMIWTGFIGLRISTMAGSCERVNATVGNTKKEISRIPEEALPSQGTLLHGVSGTSCFTTPNNSIGIY
jgi:hypothetical protein